MLVQQSTARGGRASPGHWPCWGGVGPHGGHRPLPVSVAAPSWEPVGVCSSGGGQNPGPPPTGSCALIPPIPQDTDIQKKIDHEIRMREGACKLLAACTQREQALEATKSLLVCNSRILAYMSELQRMKEVQVMQRVARR